MKWALFRRVMVKLVGIRELDPQRDAARYAEQLLSLNPNMFARIDGGVESVVARMSARMIAVDHLREVCRMPLEIEALERSLSIATMTASERLVRVAGLAYLVCEHDLIRDDLPAGYGFIDDCIALRGSRLATPAVVETDRLVEDLTMIQYLSVAVTKRVLPEIEAALVAAAEVAQRTRKLPDHVLEQALWDLIEHPPTEFPAKLLLPQAPEQLCGLESPLELEPGVLVETGRDTLLIEFPNGTRLRRHEDASLTFE